MDDSPDPAEKVGDDQMILISANRSEAEKREAYGVEWQEPVNKPSLADQIRRLF